VSDCFIDRFNQGARPGNVLLQNLPVRLERGDFFELSLAYYFLDAL